MSRFRPTILAVVALICSGPVAALEPYVSFDNFNVDGVNPAKWVDGDRARSVKNNVLRLIQRDFGPTNSDVGTVGSSWGVSVTRPGPVTQLRGVVKVTGLDVTGCSANASPSRVRARVLGTFFNTGNRVSGNHTGDMLAQIFLQRASNSTDGPGVLQVGGGLFLCTNGECSLGQSVASVTGLGTANIGETVTLAIEWDRPSRTFNFVRDDGTSAVQLSYPSSLSDTQEPGQNIKTVATRTDMAACASGPQTIGSIEATFDTASVNKKGRP